ncbi:hypothetical protein ACFW2Y_09110 [Streptomyces sp. NPDC058877]
MENEVLAAPEDERKRRRASTKPTILPFDAARTGMTRIRPQPYGRSA